MRVHRIIPNLRVPDVGATADFYAGFLGLTHEDLGLGWVTRYVAPSADDGSTAGAEIQVVTGDAAAPQDAVASVLVDDVDAAYDEARARGYEIVHPLTTEAWGVRRFFVRAPDGNVLNVAAHRR
ncbi:VOC family protein [Cellulomonas cellasea]|uniref:Catechol 2,3-dioxygenase-like lactoylglutathione lyase family enzyme n=1 Tax=Cellulomonas cellasea TaxID=43670 RepID=A0A7W4UHT6_9CELL|nr:VOC family protein [Cellulomonas cellasea]MBB2924421.1 catechol 2,3-dioxygenase-like lactoylglutathione lyase family enzyme [Cellulomonas cellasea]